MDDQGMARTSDVIAAADWILANRAQYGIRVANLSLHSSVANSFVELGLLGRGGLGVRQLGGGSLERRQLGVRLLGLGRLRCGLLGRSEPRGGLLGGQRRGRVG